MRILDLALKDLSQILRDKKVLLFLVAMPIVFTLFMGFAYNSDGSDENADTRLPLAVVSESDSRLSEMLLERLEASDAVRVVRLDQAEALESFQQGDVAGVLVIPPDFGEQAAGLVVSDQSNGGTNPQLTLIAEANSAAGQSLYQLLRVPLSQLMSSVEVANISADISQNPAEFAPALELAWAKWDENSRLELVRSELAVAQEQESWFGDNPYNQASPGIIVQFAIFGLVTSAQILVSERKTRTLQRLMTTTMRPWEMVAGHLLAMFALTFLQTALLVIFGQFALGVDYLREPLGTLLISVALGLWVASMGLLIGTLAKSDDQVILFALIAMFLFSALGGTWFPLEGAGGAYAALGRLTPSAWAMNGLQNLLIRGLDTSSTLLPTGILLAYALGFFLLAVWRFRKMEM
ncbi:MAG: ABC transporter permease [Chloroflexi bacterium]|nr:MAG: ABC transporter permease [Chloroflexota bacterium]